MTLSATRIAHELARTFLSWRAIPIALFIAVPIIYGLSTSATFRDPMAAFAHSLGGPATLVFAIVAVGIAVLPFSAEWKDHFIGIVRTRTSLRAYAADKFVANFISVFAVFFLFAFVAAVFFLFLQPALGVAYEPSPGSTAPANRSRLGGAYEISPLLYAVVYSAVMGLVAALFASIGFLCLFVFKSRVLALAIPFLLFVAQTALLFARGFDAFTFYLAFVQVGNSDAPSWTLLVPIVMLVVIIGFLLVRIRMLRGQFPGLA